MAAAAPAASCISTEHGCVMFDCLVHLWEWLDPPEPQSHFQMENNKKAPATQQPLTQQHLMAHHVHPDQIYQQHSQLAAHITSPQQIQPNGVMHQLLQSQYHSNIDARSPLLENRHEHYGTGHNNEFAKHYGANDNFNYSQSPPRMERTDVQTDHNVNHELLHNVPKGYNAEVYQDYMKRNPPKDTNQLYQNPQMPYRNDMNQYGSKPYLPFSNRIGPQSNTEMLRRQYNEIQQMKLQQQMHYQNKAQMQQQQKFAERQLLLQKIHGIQPPPNLQNSIYSDGSSYRDLTSYGSRTDFKDYSSPDIQKDIDTYAKNNEFKEIEKQKRQYEDNQQWQSNQQSDYRETERYGRTQHYEEHNKSQSPPSDYNNSGQKYNVSVVSPMKSSESSSPSVKSPSSDSRRSSSGTQALRSPTAQRSPSAPVTMSGLLYKQGSDGLKVWRKRWFVLSEYCLFYYKSQEEEKLLGSVLLPSYKVSACTAEDKVLRKFAFKLEHANMRTYVLAAPDQESMLKWVKALTMAALMQSPYEQSQKQSDRTSTAAKIEDEDENAGPTYANAPPKPRRANEGYNSPSPEYDPNYDLLKKPASHYSQGPNQPRYHEHTSYPDSSSQDHTQRPAMSPTHMHQQQYEQKRPYESNNLTLPLTNTTSENQYGTNQALYFNNRARNEQATAKQDQIYEKQPQRNPFLHESLQQTKDIDLKQRADQDKVSLHSEVYPNTKAEQIPYNKDVYGELNVKQRPGSAVNDRINERRTPDAYSRSNTSTNVPYKGKMSDYEDVYNYTTEAYYGQSSSKSPNTSQSQEVPGTSKQQQERIGNYGQEKTFSGPSVLRRKKMQASGIQPPVPRPHSADFLEYEARNEMLNKSLPNRTMDAPRQPQRPKSSLDINSYYDPSSDRYYSEENYAEKMRQSAQYLHQTLSPRNIQIPLAKYASGLAEKQLHSPYSQATNNNYEMEFGAKRTREPTGYNSNYADIKSLNSNWMLKEKAESQKEFLNRSGSAMSAGSNAGIDKDMSRFDPSSEGFMRSASARLPSTGADQDGEKKVQQREESMKRLLEWKQRMLQSPLTRKSTPATISLARSLNQSRQSTRSDQYKPKTYGNATYNSYSSDDEEESADPELQKRRDTQAGRSHRMSESSTVVTQPAIPLAPSTNPKPENLSESQNLYGSIITSDSNSNSTYENINLTNIQPTQYSDNDNNDIVDVQNVSVEIEEDEYVSEEICNTEAERGYETHDSESETELEYTDNDLDEVLLDEDKPEIENENVKEEVSVEVTDTELHDTDYKPDTPTCCVVGEGHYLPMSPRKMSTTEPAHITLLKSLENLSVFDQTMPFHYEDNPYVEMNLNNEEEDAQTYELVCVNNGKSEPVYMELGHVAALKAENSMDEKDQGPKSLLDVASNFADTKNQTLKRASKTDKSSKSNKLEKSDCSDADDESSKDVSIENSLKRFSISDSFRPASYYLNSRNNSDVQVSSDSESQYIKHDHSSSRDAAMTDEALSQYILDKLDKADLSQDNSILKMLTNESQKMNTAKRKTTSLMIYGSRTSIHDTLSRGEKARNNRASLNSERSKLNEVQPVALEKTLLEHYSSSASIETDSLQSYNADRGSSRLSLDSDLSSKFEISTSKRSSGSSAAPSLSELNEESMIELRNQNVYQNIDMMIKRRPLSDDSIFELVNPTNVNQEEPVTNIDLDKFLDNLQPSTSSGLNLKSANIHLSFTENIDAYKNNVVHAAQLQTASHKRCSSTPVACAPSLLKTTHLDDRRFPLIQRNIGEQTGYSGSQSSCSSSSVAKSPVSYYYKNYEEANIGTKNIIDDITADNISTELENDRATLKSGNATSIHSRESSTEHSAPYYYSDLSSQEHINVLPTSHYLKNTNIHRKLNNQRRRGPMHKKNEISHIHNPIRNHQMLKPERPFDLDIAARSVSVEFLSAAEKDLEIDDKNIYESGGGKISKIPESINLSGFGCKRNSSSSNDNSLQDSSLQHSLNTSLSTKASNTSVSSHCSGNSTNTVYYDAEAEVGAYENVCYGEKHWDEDTLWRDNLRRVSQRHARSMDDLDSMPMNTVAGRSIIDMCGMNSIKRVKINVSQKISRNATYVNCDVQGQVLKRNEINYSFSSTLPDDKDENDVYVSLAENAEVDHSDEGVYEQLAIDSENSVTPANFNRNDNSALTKRRFEIDREKLRQWDLMSSGLIKARVGGVKVKDAGCEAICSTDSGADSASNEASMTMSGANVEIGMNNSGQQALSKKAFLGSNTSIGRSNRDNNIPVRAVSPRVRWVEDKNGDHYGSQQTSASQQNLHTLNMTEDSWANVRSPSRASQQPIRAVSPRVRRNTENDDMQRRAPSGSVPNAGELLGRTHEELVLLLIQLRRRHAATNRAIAQCCAQIQGIEDSLSTLKAMEREESLKKLEQLKLQLMELENQYEKSKPLVTLVDNMVKLGSLYNRPGSTVERLERNQRLRQKVLAEHALEQQRWLESAAQGKSLETEAARARVAELWALEQELADEAAILRGIRTDKDTIENLLTGVRGKLDSVHASEVLPEHPMTADSLEAELARVHAMLALNSKKLEQTVADNARLERELQSLRRALQTRRCTQPPAHATTMLEDEVSRVQQLVGALQRQRQELSRAVRLLTQQSRALQTTQDSMPGKQQQRRPTSSWQETNLDTGHTMDHGEYHYDYNVSAPLMSPGQMYDNMDTPLYVDTMALSNDLTSPINSEDMQNNAFANLSSVEKQEIKTVRIVKRESERRHRDRERSLQPDWAAPTLTANLDQFLEEELHPPSGYRASSLPRTDFSKFEEYYTKPQEPPNYLHLNQKMSAMELSPKFPSSPSLSNYDYSRDISSLTSSYNPNYNTSDYDRTISYSTQYLNSSTDSSRTLTNDPLSKTNSIGSLTRSNMELSPIFKSEAAKQIITEMSGDVPKNGSLHRRQVPKEKRRHYTAPHHLSAKTLNEMPKNGYNQDKLGRSLDDADMERALRAPPDVVRSTIQPQRFADNTIDSILAAPQKIVIPERYIPEKPPELSPEEQQKRQEKVESIKKMLSSSSAADPSKSPDQEEKKQRAHLLQMNQILAKQVTEMSKIIAVKALKELPLREMNDEYDERSPDVELPIYQQRDNFFT